MSHRIFRALPALALLALAACASLPAGDLAPANSPPPDLQPLLQPAGAATASAETRAPAGMLTRERALRQALAGSPRLQAEYARHGLAAAERLQAGLPANPGFGFGRLSSNVSGPQINRVLGLPLADWLLQPARKRLAEGEYQAARRDIAEAIIGTVRDVEAAWFEAVAAGQVAELRKTTAEASDATAELAKRFFDAGNISELQLRQEQAAASEARIAHARARAVAVKARTTLLALVGLAADDPGAWLPGRLPLPVANEDALPDLQALAATHRLDLHAARTQVQTLEAAAKSQRRWRGLLDAGVELEHESEGDGSRKRGAALAIELPLFDQGQGRVAIMAARLQSARAELSRRELGSAHSLRTLVSEVAAAREVVAIHREALLPQREAIVARQQERQNFMLIGVFELIAARRHEFDAYQSYLEAIRDYWLARTELARAIGTRLPSDGSVVETAEPVLDWLRPRTPSGPEGMQHSPPKKPGNPAATPESRQPDPDHSRHHHQGGQP